jgi:hypothetical protein
MSTQRMLDRSYPLPRPTRKTALRTRSRAPMLELPSTSALDEARRRLKRNVGQIEGILRLEERSATAASTEGVLADMAGQLQTMASDQRAACRSGEFDGIDLAVYLKEIAAFLSRSTGRGTDRGGGARGGWVLADSGNVLSWIRSHGDPEDERLEGGRDLGDAISFLSPELKEMMVRAACACAVAFPPGVFSWRTAPPRGPQEAIDHPAFPGDLWIRLQPAADHWRVDVSIDDRSLGLPRRPDCRLRERMERDLASVLAALFEGAPSEPRSEVRVAFSVSVVSSGV